MFRAMEFHPLNRRRAHPHLQERALQLASVDRLVMHAPATSHNTTTATTIKKKQAGGAEERAVCPAAAMHICSILIYLLVAG
jgi:hypothetical protein